MKAQDLAGGLRNFHPAPIRFGPGGTEDFYVRRRDDPLDLLRAQLLHGQASEKTLLAGHRGSGKSTELNRLCADSEIRKRFAVVKFSVKDVLDLTDLSHIDLLFTAVALSYDELCTGPEALELSAQTMAELDRWRKLVAGGLVEEKTRTHDEAAGAEVTAGAKLSLLLGSFFAGITGRLRVEQTTRQVTREMVEPRLSEFLKTLDRFFQDVDLALGSRDRRLL
ncbi:MAG: hypothetical protein GY856_07115, partial [bacterium]|nr:hypothetical protein [bacterium]